MFTPTILRDIHDRQLQEIQGARPFGGPLSASLSTLRQTVGHGLIRVGSALASDGSRQQKNPC